MIVASIFAPREDRFGCDYDALLRLLDASCRRLGLRHVVISDAPRPGLETARFDLPANLMQLLLDGQRQFLASLPPLEPVLFVGADCLVTSRTATRFPSGLLADIAITTSPTFSDCEMNTGAIWCADGPTCAPVWQAALARNPVEWGDDQRALYAAIQESGLKVERLRCEDHNWAPDDAADPAGMPTVVHFRGRRKRFMADWAARHLGVA